MQYNYNGTIKEGEEFTVALGNRALNYGDGMFETIRYSHGRLNFWEKHYFRLMASMRIVRMEIPMSFSPEFLEEEIRKTIEANALSDHACRVKLLVYRKNGGLYTPVDNNIDYLIQVKPLNEKVFELNEQGLTVDLYKDFYKQKGLLGNLKSTSAQFYTLASVFRAENELDECILLNTDKSVIEGISSNIFMVKDQEVITPTLASGCLKGVLREVITELVPKMKMSLREEDFSPFALQKADEIFFTNAIKGVQWVERYRKKRYGYAFAAQLTKRLNTEVALNSN